MRNKELVIEDHYVDINAEAVFYTCKEKIPLLRKTIQKMTGEL